MAIYEAPLRAPIRKVEPAWIDYNGHMNVAYYVLAFDQALDRFFDRVGIGIDYVRETGNSVFTLQNHVCYLREVKEGDPLAITFQLIDCDARRAHYFMTMNHAEEGYRAATAEQLAIHVSLESRRASPFPPAIRERFEALKNVHAGLPRPAELGKAIALKPSSAA